MVTASTFFARCPNCHGGRRCEVFGETSQTHSEDYHCRTEWRLLKCTSCNDVFTSIRFEDYESGDYVYNSDTNEDEFVHKTTDTSWPPFRKRPIPDIISGFLFPDTLESAIVETYGAFNADLPMLAAVGARSCFDIAAVLLGATESARFNQKLDALVESKHITSDVRSMLNVLVDAGGASIHRGWKPKDGDMQTILEVLEHFLDDNFVRAERLKLLDAKTQKLRTKIPPRSR